MRRRSQLALIGAALLLAFFPERDRSTAELLGEYIWDYPDIRWFGGISAIETTNGGTWYLASTDRGLMFTGPVMRDAQTGMITLIPPRRAWGVKSSSGTRQTGRLSDSEGLAIAADGSVFASFEAVHRVAHFQDPEGRGAPIRRPPEFHEFPGNGGIEALAIDADGALYALPEHFTKRGRIPVYRRRDGVWDTELSIRATLWMRPVAADIGPDGRLYVLERNLSFLGFKTQLRRWDITDERLVAERTLIDAPRRSYGNLEGLDVWRDQTGALRALIVEDNNFWPFNKTSLLEFRLPE